MTKQHDSISDMYKNQFFKSRNKALSWRVTPLCDAIENVFKFNSIVDVGCATGDFLREFQKRGKDIFGLEGSKWAFDHMQIGLVFVEQRDLRYEFVIKNKFDLCMSLEVAEHIEPDFVENYVKTLCNLSDNILISAAKPGQKGHHHYNCQGKKYWLSLFAENEFEYDIRKTSEFRGGIKQFAHKKGLNSYYNNSMVFKKVTGNND